MTQDHITEENITEENMTEENTTEDSIEASSLYSEATENATDAVVESISLGADAELLAVFDGDDDDDDDEEEEIEPSPYDRPGRWYVVHTYAGYENKVKQNLTTRMKALNVEELIYEIVIPTEDVIEFKNGRKVVVQKKVWPGYLIIRMVLDDETWGAVRNTPGVTGFVGNGAKPSPLSRREVEDTLGSGGPLEGKPEKKLRPRFLFEKGEQVRVVTGAFADFNGIIDEIDIDRSKLKVLVNIFGRETPVELEIADVAKL